MRERDKLESKEREKKRKNAWLNQKKGNKENMQQRITRERKKKWNFIEKENGKKKTRQDNFNNLKWPSFNPLTRSRSNQTLKIFRL